MDEEAVMRRAMRGILFAVVTYALLSTQQHFKFSFTVFAFATGCLALFDPYSRVVRGVMIALVVATLASPPLITAAWAGITALARP